MATNAFVDGMHSGLLVAAGAALLGSLIAFVFLPARAPRDSEDAQHAATDEARVQAAAGNGAAVNGGAGVPEPAMEALTMGAAAGVEARRPGRPRSAEADEAILAAAFERVRGVRVRRHDRRRRRARVPASARARSTGATPASSI